MYTFYNYDGTKTRPWDNAKEADEYMIEQYNNMVRPNDKVYFLGDVGFRKNDVDKVLSKLNGTKVLIKGNHDKFKLNWYMLFFKDVRGCHNLDNYLLTHIPVHPSSKARFKRNLHGHIHANKIIPEDPWYRNCCVEVNEYKPIPFDLIIEETKELKEKGLI
jgi:calcineurin-like phosphoesterase family protein